MKYAASCLSSKSHRAAVYNIDVQQHTRTGLCWAMQVSCQCSIWWTIHMDLMYTQAWMCDNVGVDILSKLNGGNGNYRQKRWDTHTWVAIWMVWILTCARFGHEGWRSQKPRKDRAVFFWHLLWGKHEEREEDRLCSPMKNGVRETAELQMWLSARKDQITVLMYPQL